MPGTWSNHTKLSHTEYQIVTIIIALTNDPVGIPLHSFCSDLPIFVVRCTGPDAFHFLSSEEGDPGDFIICGSEAIHENNYLA